MPSPSENSLPPSFDTLYAFCPSSTQPSGYDSLRLTEQECLGTLRSPVAQRIFGHEGLGDASLLADVRNGSVSFTDFVGRNVHALLSGEAESADIVRSRLVHVGYASLLAFLQSNVTGPPLSFRPGDVVLPSGLTSGEQGAEVRSVLRRLRDVMIRGLSVDGEAAYKLTPNVELFCVAKAIFTSEKLFEVRESGQEVPVTALTARMRIVIYEDLDAIAKRIFGESSVTTAEQKMRYLLERAAIHTHHGLDSQARADLEHAARENGFEFALTGRLGKRTKFQDRDISQLVVLAKSRSLDTGATSREVKPGSSVAPSGPKNLDLNDDTLLEAISFKRDDGDQKSGENAMTVQEESALPQSLAELDPSEQPKLDPLDSIVLLALASAITNTNPEDGLTREETLPYATRVLDGGSSNWQVYSQALLVRSRIEGYRSRTVERGVLQLQALVDQVIADTASDSITTEEEQAHTFLPRPDASESAPASERLEYIWVLSFVTRWDLEAELAARWVNLGGLRTALDIYERLQMWAEAALCYAATDREDKAKLIVRRQLFEPSTPGGENDEDERFEGPERSPLPVDAPRLFCILGDVNKDYTMFERAWAVSKQRYARAQRALARYYLGQKPPKYEKAEEAYKLSLKISRLNHAAWFSLGCIQLELEKWRDACIDVPILTALINTLTADYNFDDPDSAIASSSSGNKKKPRPGTFPALIYSLIDDSVVPLITHSSELWLLVAKLEKWRGRPSRALAAHEKAWRAMVASCTSAAFQMGDEKKWMDMVRSTETLVKQGYAALGGMDKEAEDGGEETGEMVAKDWRFKARSAVRGILGKGKEIWEGSEGWLRLKGLAEEGLQTMACQSRLHKYDETYLHDDSKLLNSRGHAEAWVCIRQSSSAS
ncbi:TPR repeat-containing protein [Coccidioides immitis RMSCC 3703]|uniref:TPR repeat-containing protein n=1 Tax=Coccidioides immitis RMSCC 3703 TaxID=454286 RepID=A0A0J8R0Q2_COCIT|nr:TPR repeat-containing protein [Coccidioides immitis RMSCC 3703]